MSRAEIRTNHKFRLARPKRFPGLLISRVVAMLGVTMLVAALAASPALAADTSPPSKPGSFAAKYYGGVGAVLTWTKSSSSDRAGYNVYSSSTSAVPRTAAARLGTTTALTFTDATIPAGSTRYYAITAYDKAGNESGLTSVKAVVATDKTKPATPSSLKATASVAGIALDWKDNTEPDLKGYLVTRSASSGGPWATLNPTPITTSAFLDSTAAVGLKSYYRVVAVDLSGNTSSYDSASATRPADPSQPPPAPTEFTASVSSAGVVTLKWKAAAGATSYTITRTASEATSTLATGVTVLTYVDGAAPRGVPVTYAVTAVNANGASVPATLNLATIKDTQAPTTPQTATVTVLTTGGVSVTWPANTEPDLAGYVVYKRNTSGSYVRFLPSAPAPTVLTEPGFTDASLSEGSTALYRVYAVDTSGNQSSYRSVTATVPVTIPDAPTALTATANATGGIDLAWVAPAAPDVASYTITRATSATGPFTTLSTLTTATAGSPPHSTDSAVVAGTTYYYRVIATDLSGNASPVSNTANATAASPLLKVGADKPFQTISAALASIPAGSTDQYRVEIDPGTYSEVVTIAHNGVTLVGMGDDPKAVVITAANASGTAKPGGGTYGTGGSATMFVSGANVTLQNLSVVNAFDEAAHPEITSQQAVALRVEGDRFIANKVRLIGNQDTLLADAPDPGDIARQYFVDSYIEGDVDYVFGAATAVFQRTIFNSLDRGKSNNGYITAASTDTSNPRGYLIVDSRVVSSAAPGSVNLGRPWHPGGDPNALASVVFKNTVLPDAIDTVAPWDDMSGFSWAQARFAECDNTGPGAGPLPNTNRPQLSASDCTAATAGAYLAGSDQWNPVTAAPTGAPAAPTALSATTDLNVAHLTWGDDLSAMTNSWSIWRADLTGQFTKIGTAYENTWSDTSAVTGSTYQYYVVAESRNGTSSAPSRTISVTITRAPLTIDLTVDPTATANGTTVFNTVADALAAAPAGTLADPMVIALKPGRYAEYPTISKAYTILVGSSGRASDVVITGNRASGTPKPDGTGSYGTSGSATLVITGNNVQLRDLTVENAYQEGTFSSGQAVALRTTGDRLTFDNIRLLGNQDTLYVNTTAPGVVARSYFHNCYIEGDVDFIFGRGTAVFDQCTLSVTDHGTTPNGAVTAPSTDAANPFGILITNSRILGAAPDGSESLGRPWTPDPNSKPQAVVRDSWLGNPISPTTPWVNMVNSGVDTDWRAARFAEYNNSGPGAGSLPSTLRPQLSDSDAAGFTATSYLAGTDGWNPVVPALSDVAPAAPTGVQAVAGDRSATVTWGIGTDYDVVKWLVFRAVSPDSVVADAAHQVAEVTKPTLTDSGLTNGTQYSYAVQAVDRAGNVSALSSVVQVTANPAPLVADVTVAADGSGDVTTVQAALDRATAGTPADPTVIMIKPGSYREVINSSKANLLIVGSSGQAGDVVISFDNANGTPVSASTCPRITAATCGTFGSATATLTGAGVQVRDLTIQNAFDRTAHPEIGQFNTQAVALRATGDKQVYRNVRLLGEQDTLNADAAGNISADGSGYPRQYYVNCFIEGNVDFVFGRATAVFDRTTLHATARSSGFVFAPSHAANNPHGYLLIDSRIASDNDPGVFSLGRPWQAWGDGTQPANSRGKVVIRDSWIAAGFNVAHPWSDFPPLLSTDGRFVEYKNTGPGATINANRPQLSDSQAADETMAAYLAGADSWNPVLPTSADVAPATPTGLRASPGDGQISLSWNENQESDVVGYRVYQDGVAKAEVTRPSLTVTGLTNGTSYTFGVAALDAAGHESSGLATATATPAMQINATVQPGGDYPTLQSAVNAATGSGQWTIKVQPGSYSGTTSISRSNVRIIGAGAADVTLTNATATPTLTVTGSNVTVQGVTIANTAGVSNSPALYTTGDQLVVRDSALNGTNRTVWADVPTAGATSKVLIDSSTITGTTQIILGRATLVVRGGTITVNQTSGLVLVPSTTAVGGHGFLLLNNTIAPATGVSDVRLGGGYAQGTTDATNAPQAWIVSSTLNAGIKANPWMDFNGFTWSTGRFAEYQNTGAGALATGVTDSNRPQLNADDAASATVAGWFGAGAWYAG